MLQCYGTIMFVTLWAISGIVALGAQCRLPTPWVSGPGRCINQQALHTYIAVGNIITDIALVVIPILVIWHIQTSLKVRLQVIALFMLRIM